MLGMATQLGDLDLAFEILAGFVTEAGLYPLNVGWTPLFETSEAASRLRSDARFAELMRNAGYPEYWRKYGWPDSCQPEGEDFRCS